ncbi:unnamed protein product [Ectocarpus sp. 4 AP-2014]
MKTITHGLKRFYPYFSIGRDVFTALPAYRPCTTFRFHTRKYSNRVLLKQRALNSGRETSRRHNRRKKTPMFETKQTNEQTCHSTHLCDVEPCMTVRCLFSRSSLSTCLLQGVLRRACRQARPPRMPQHDVDTPAAAFSLARTCIAVGRMTAGVGWLPGSSEPLRGFPTATSFPAAWVIDVRAAPAFSRDPSLRSAASSTRQAFALLLTGRDKRTTT